MEQINLNLIPNGLNPICHCSQYDVGRVIRVNLFDGSVPYSIASGDTITLNVRKPDNTIVTKSLTATAGNSYVDIETTQQMCACAGNNLCDLSIRNNNDVIGTVNFIMAIERDVIADGIPSHSEIEDLDALVAEAVESELGDNYYTKSEVDEALALKASASEVENIRVGVDGKVYPSAGNAVRSQIGELDDALTTNKIKSGVIVEFNEKPKTATIKTRILDAKTNLQLFVGKNNLLVHPYFRGDTYENNGITYTVNADKSITANGTADGDSICNINYYATPNWIPSGIVYFSGCTGGSADTYYLANNYTGHKQTNDEIAFSIGNNTLNIAIVIKSGVTVNNKVFKPMISLKSSIEYEPAGKLYTATVESGTTQHTWDNIQLNDGYNLIMAQNGDTVIVNYTELVSIGNNPFLENHWSGKKWVAFGTSITATNNTLAPDGTPTGKYVPYLKEMGGFSESEFVNRGIAGGCINGHILYYIRFYLGNHTNYSDYKADLITIEGSVNDEAGAIPLGQVGDTVPYTNALLPDSSESGTFAGACYCAFSEAIQNAPNATIVFLTDSTGKQYNQSDFSYYHTNSLGLRQIDYIEMACKVAKYVGIPVIRCGQDSMINRNNPDYIIDQIHHTELGGYQYAKTIWSKLREIPLKALNLPE